MLRDCYSTTHRDNINDLLACIELMAIRARLEPLYGREQGVQLLVRIADSVRATKTLEQLSQHKHSDVRIAVSDNPCTPQQVMLNLAADLDLDVRYAVAENPHAPLAALLLLEDDTNPYIASRATKTIARLSTDSFPSVGATIEELSLRDRR